MQVLISDKSLPSKIESTNGSGCTTTGSTWGKGWPGQEMHHGIVLYHVAEMWAERDEKGVWEREEEESGWSGDFVLRCTIVRLHCEINKDQTTFLDQNFNRMSCYNLTRPVFWGCFPLVQWCIHIPASAHKWPV